MVGKDNRSEGNTKEHKTETNLCSGNTACSKISIDAADVIRARALEIQCIEESIKKSNKKSMLFQRMPFYKRRRNRNYDKRSTKKFSYRKKDRHFLRTHTYYAKRFFMLKLKAIEQTNYSPETSKNYYEDVSIPFKRRIKSSKYIYKSQDRGFVFDDSFRGVSIYDTEDFMANRYEGLVERNPHMMPISVNRILASVNLEKYGEVQNIDNLFDFVITKENIYLFGGFIIGSHNQKTFTNCSSSLNNLGSKNSESDSLGCESKSLKTVIETNIDKENIANHPRITTFSIIHDISYDFYELKKYSTVKIFVDKSGGLFSHKIICSRAETMHILQDLINNNVIAISLEEIHRLATEKNQITVYDDIRSNIYRSIEFAVNQEIIDKYNRTPPSKKQSYDLNDLFISKDPRFYSKCIEHLLSIKDNLLIKDDSRIEEQETLKLKSSTANAGFDGSSSSDYSVAARYVLFKVIKGSLTAGAFVYDEDQPIGRVIRSSFRFSEGSNICLCALYIDSNIDIAASIESKTIFFAKNLTQSNYYEIVMTRVFS